jgi:hypothetical protein
VGTGDVHREAVWRQRLHELDDVARDAAVEGLGREQEARV